jgi:hypothetical protein
MSAKSRAGLKSGEKANHARREGRLHMVRAPILPLESRNAGCPLVPVHCVSGSQEKKLTVQNLMAISSVL